MTVMMLFCRGIHDLLVTILALSKTAPVRKLPHQVGLDRRWNLLLLNPWDDKGPERHDWGAYRPPNRPAWRTVQAYLTQALNREQRA